MNFLSYIRNEFRFVAGHNNRGKFKLSKADILDRIKKNTPHIEIKSDFTDIQSKVICNDIIKIGGMQNKSLIIKFPDVPKEYLSDFIK